MATAQNKLREVILVSERKRGSLPYKKPALACRAHASGMHSRFCDTVGQNCGQAMMNLSHVEDEPEPPTTRFAQFSPPSHQRDMKAMGMVVAREVGGWDKGEAQQGCHSLVPALAVKTVNSTQISCVLGSIAFLQFS